MNPQPDKAQFLTLLKKSLESDTFVKLTLSKSTGKESELENVYIRPVEIRGKVMLAFTLRYTTKDIAKNYNIEEAIAFIDFWLGTAFLNATLFSLEADYTLRYSKKWKPNLFKGKPTFQDQEKKAHNREKKTWIDPVDNIYLQALGLTNTKGEFLKSGHRKFRQINKYVETIGNLLSSKSANQDIKIVDVGSGKGYLTFALYDYLSRSEDWNPEITGIELRQHLVDFCNNLAHKCDFKNLRFIAKDINNYEADKIDMLIALHACDIATDIAIAKGIKSKAEIIVVAPCCHKQVRKQMNCETHMSAILKHGIMKERQAELVTDGIRALLLEAHGYKTRVFEFISTEHTSKNVMIVGTKSEPNPEALEKIEAIKKEYGIAFHYLEKLL